MYETKKVQASGFPPQDARVHPDDLSMIEEMRRDGWERYNTSVNGAGNAFYKFRRSVHHVRNDQVDEHDVDDEPNASTNEVEAPPALDAEREGESTDSELDTADLS